PVYFFINGCRRHAGHLQPVADKRPASPLLFKPVNFCRCIGPVIQIAPIRKSFYGHADLRFSIPLFGQSGSQSPAGIIPPAEKNQRLFHRGRFGVHFCVFLPALSFSFSSLISLPLPPPMDSSFLAKPNLG